VRENPIYYKAYKSYLAGESQLAEIVGSSKLQAYLIAELIYWLRTYLGKSYYIFTNELGIQFEKNYWRAADMVLVEKMRFSDQTLNQKYLDIPPDIIVEVDTKAELTEIENPLGYYQEKTQDFLDFGVQKVIWLFTDTQKVLVATGTEKWEISDWSKDIEVLPEIHLNVKALFPGGKFDF